MSTIINKKPKTRAEQIKENVKIEAKTMVDIGEDGHYSKGALHAAGQAMTQSNTTYVGSAVVHYYGDKVTGNSFTFVTLGNISEQVPELVVSLGFDELRKKVMSIFGRKVKNG